jgi:hypothetical protein
MGTMPMVVIVDGRCKVEPGKRIRWREAQHGSKWRHARVEKVYPDGYFFAEVV